MSTEKLLREFLPGKGITIIGGYQGVKLLVYVALYELEEDNRITVTFPKGHRFSPGQSVTLHLDNRTGVDEYDSDLRVFRASYKGKILNADKMRIDILPQEFMCFYSDYCVLKYISPAYEYEAIEEQNPLPESEISPAELNWTDREYENKLGVFMTRLQKQPHSSLMAFLSNECDDIFLITLTNTFKSRVIHRNNRCCFAIDHRSDFVFEKAYDWNYTIINAEAYTVSRDNPAFGEIQDHFVEKNPWESSFFLSPDIEMYHLKPLEILMPDTL